MSECDGGWSPDEATLAAANLTRFQSWLAETGRGEYANYQELWAKAVDEDAWVWDAVWNFYDIEADSPAPAGLADPPMRGAEWFPGATMNYASEIWRHATDERPAMIVAS